VLRVELELPGANLKGTRFQNQAASLNVSAESLYAALVADAENLPPNFDLQGRQADAWIEHRAALLLLARRFSFIFPLLRLLTHRCPQDCTWFCPRARRIPRSRGARRVITSPSR
jgi:hypothetical protein